MDPEGHVVEAGVEVGPSLKLLSDHCKGAGTSEASGQTKEKLCVNDILDIRKCSKADQIMGANKYSC